MERAIDVIPIVGVDISGVIVIKASIIIIDKHAAHSKDTSMSIGNINVAYLRNTTVIIVEYGNIFYLYYGTIVVVLGIRTIIISRVEGDAISAAFHIIVYVKIKLPIRVHGKRNAVLHKNKGVVVSISIAWCNLIFFCTVGHNTRGA
jgi:hypothetical protein